VLVKRTILFKLKYIHFLPPLDIKRRSLHATIAPVPMDSNKNLGAKPRRRPLHSASTSEVVTRLPATRAPDSDSKDNAEGYDAREVWPRKWVDKAKAMPPSGHSRAKISKLVKMRKKSSGTSADVHFTMRKRPPATRAPDSDSEDNAEGYDARKVWPGKWVAKAKAMPPSGHSRAKISKLLETRTKSSGAYAGDHFTMRKRPPATRAPNSDSEDNASLIIPRASDGPLVAAARKVLADAIAAEERSQSEKKKYAWITAQASI
jgi:hypothetical protein